MGVTEEGTSMSDEHKTRPDCQIKGDRPFLFYNSLWLPFKRGIEEDLLVFYTDQYKHCWLQKPKTMYRVLRFLENPIIHAQLDDQIGTNINGPSLIRVPGWVSEPLGRYYLYFAHHLTYAWHTPTAFTDPGRFTTVGCWALRKPVAGLTSPPPMCTCAPHNRRSWCTSTAARQKDSALFGQPRQTGSVSMRLPKCWGRSISGCFITVMRGLPLPKQSMPQVAACSYAPATASTNLSAVQTFSQISGT